MAEKSAANVRAVSSRTDLVTETCERLRDLIIAGRLAPGAPIIERQAADRLGVSRSTIRSALQRLEQQGYVLSTALRKYSRVVVAPLTIDDMEDLYNVVGAIDGLGASRAACLGSQAREILVSELRVLNRDLLDSSRVQRNFNRAYEIDSEFHRLYVTATAPPRLLAQYSMLSPQTERYGRLYASALIDEIGRSVDEHEAIIQAVAAGDSEAARRAAEANWRHAVERFRQEISRVGERGTW
jgi:DNA-binding GntR family transcriptional regulator